MKRNGLLYGIRKAHLTGSGKAQYTNKAQAMRVAKILYQQGGKPTYWHKITNRHVSIVVEEWKRRGLKISTIKFYLGSIRAAARAYRNGRINKDNSEFEIAKRFTIPTTSRAVPKEVYEVVRNHLLAGFDRQQRIGHQMVAMKELGLRHEEARKMDPVALQPDGR